MSKSSTFVPNILETTYSTTFSKELFRLYHKCTRKDINKRAILNSCLLFLIRSNSVYRSATKFRPDPKEISWFSKILSQIFINSFTMKISRFFYLRSLPSVNSNCVKPVYPKPTVQEIEQSNQTVNNAESVTIDLDCENREEFEDITGEFSINCEELLMKIVTPNQFIDSEIFKKFLHDNNMELISKNVKKKLIKKKLTKKEK